MLLSHDDKLFVGYNRQFSEPYQGYKKSAREVPFNFVQANALQFLLAKFVTLLHILILIALFNEIDVLIVKRLLFSLVHSYFFCDQ